MGSPRGLFVCVGAALLCASGFALASRAAPAAKPLVKPASAKTSKALVSAYAKRHGGARPAVLRAKIGSTTTSTYALAWLRGVRRQPEMFHLVSGAWRDLGASGGAPCSLPSAFVAAFGYAAACDEAAPPGLTTPTPPAEPTGTASTTQTLPSPDPNPPNPPSINDADLRVTGAAIMEAPDGSCDVAYVVRNGNPGYSRASVPTTRAHVTLVTRTGFQAAIDDTIPGGGGGVSYSSRVHFPDAWCSKSGAYLVTIEIDVDRAVAESDEGNNAVQAVDDPTTTFLPDLKVVDVSLTNCNRVDVTITNIGKGASPAEPNDVQFDAVSRDASKPGRIETTQRDLPALAPGQTVTLSVGWSGPCSNLFLNGIADTFKLFVDEDWSNNYIVKQI